MKRQNLSIKGKPNLPNTFYSTTNSSRPQNNNNTNTTTNTRRRWPPPPQEEDGHPHLLGPVPRRPAARLDRRTSYFDENQASQAKKPSKNDMPSPHRRRSGGPAAGMVTFRHSFPPQTMRRPYQKNAAKSSEASPSLCYLFYRNEIDNMGFIKGTVPARKWQCCYSAESYILQVVITQNFKLQFDLKSLSSSLQFEKKRGQSVKEDLRAKFSSN